MSSNKKVLVWKNINQILKKKLLYRMGLVCLGRAFVKTTLGLLEKRFAAVH